MTESDRTPEDLVRAQVRDARLSETFVSLADTLVDDYDIVDFLDFLVASCVDLFDVTAAGILLRDPRGNLSPVASSNEETRLLELFQLQNDEGPCLESVRTGNAVSSADLTQDARPLATLRAGRARASASAPCRRCRCGCARDTIGGLNLFSAGQPPLTGAERGGGPGPRRRRDRRHPPATVAAPGLAARRAAAGGPGLPDRDRAGQGRPGRERSAWTWPTAFESLRGYARSSNLKLSVVADDLVRRRLDAQRRPRVRAEPARAGVPVEASTAARVLYWCGRFTRTP